MRSHVDKALQSWEAWNQIGFAGREIILRRFAQTLDEDLQALALWRIEIARELIGTPIVLPNPTGEANSLACSGRGLILCACVAGSSPLVMIDQICSALIAGNVVLIFADQAADIAKQLVHAGCPKDGVKALPLASFPSMLEDNRIAGAAYFGSLNEIQNINRSIVSTPGIITQLIAQDSASEPASITDPFYINRFITERTLTINTTAIGGNASLLGLGSI